MLFRVRSLLRASSAPLAALVLCALLSAFLPARSHADDGPAPELRFSVPSGFAELAPDSDLFRRSAAEAVAHGRLLRLFLPQDMERLYAEGKPHAVTRQVLICGPEGEQAPLDRKSAELMARSAEGMFIGFAQVPQRRDDSPEQKAAARAEALRLSLEKGTSLLVDSLRTPSAYLHTCLIHFRMAEKPESLFLPMALASALVPVKDTVLTVTVSSLLDGDDAERHLAWVKKTASDFADALAQSGRTRKKP